MTPGIHRLCNVLGWCGAALLVAVSFPLIALGLYIVRALFLIVVCAAAFGVSVAYCTSPPFRAWVAAHVHGLRPTHPTA